MGVPSLQYMETQLELYLEDTLPSCLKDFTSFKEEGFTVETGELKTIAEFSSSVNVKLEYPITLRKDDSETNLDEFRTTIPINMPNIQDIASTLALYENRDAFLEAHTNKLISLFSGDIQQESNLFAE